MFDWWREVMGRPRLIRTKDGGEISCKNLSAELFEKLKNAMDAPAVSLANIAPPTVDTTFDDPVVTDMPLTAIGTYKSKDGWHVVQVKYGIGGSAEIGADQKVGADKVYAIERFKILASDLDLI